MAEVREQAKKQGSMPRANGVCRHLLAQIGDGATACLQQAMLFISKDFCSQNKGCRKGYCVAC